MDIKLKVFLTWFIDLFKTRYKITVSFNKEYGDADDKVYVFTVNSLYKLICEHKKSSGAELLNPYTRNKLPSNIIKQLSELMRICKIYNLLRFLKLIKMLRDY